MIQFLKTCSKLVRADLSNGSDKQSISALGIGAQIMLLLSTRRWTVSSDLSADINLLTDMMASRGWVLRQATARNYAIWRSSRTISSSKIPLVVLPDRSIELSYVEWSDAIRLDLTKSILRMNGFEPAIETVARHLSSNCNEEIVSEAEIYQYLRILDRNIAFKTAFC